MELKIAYTVQNVYVYFPDNFSEVVTILISKVFLHQNLANLKVSVDKYARTGFPS